MKIDPFQLLARRAELRRAATERRLTFEETCELIDIACDLDGHAIGPCWKCNKAGHNGVDCQEQPPRWWEGL